MGTPLWGCFAIQIEAVRSTSPLEIPDEDLAFVIKTREGSEILLRSSSSSEKTEWIEVLRKICCLDDPRPPDDFDQQPGRQVNGIGDAPFQDHGKS